MGSGRREQLRQQVVVDGIAPALGPEWDVGVLLGAGRLSIAAVHEPGTLELPGELVAAVPIEFGATFPRIESAIFDAMAGALGSGAPRRSVRRADLCPAHDAYHCELTGRTCARNAPGHRLPSRCPLREGPRLYRRQLLAQAHTNGDGNE